VTAGNQILYFTAAPSTGVLSQVASVTTTNPVGGVLSPRGAAFVYAVDSTASAIVGYGFSGSSLTPVPGSPFSGIDGQARPTSDSSGEFLFMPGTKGNGFGVFSIGANGSLTLLNPVPSTAPATTPFSVTALPTAPRFLYASNSAAAPGEVDAAAADANTGMLSLVPGSPFTLSPAAGPTGAIANAIDNFPNNVIFVALPTANAVAVFSVDSTSGALTQVPGSPFATGRMPSGLAPIGGYLYVTNELDNNVSGFAISATGALTPLPGSPYSAGTSPNGVVADNRGHLYVTNNLSDNISAYLIDSTGALTPIAGSPFPAGTRPNAIASSTWP
jgi:hypothetical protein